MVNSLVDAVLKNVVDGAVAVAKGLGAVGGAILVIFVAKVGIEQAAIALNIGIDVLKTLVALI